MRAFNWYSNSEMENVLQSKRTLEDQVQAWRERAISSESKAEVLQIEIENLRAKNDQLTDLVISLRVPQVVSQQNNLSDQEPLKMLPQSWPRMQRNLERRDRELAQRNKPGA